VTLKKLEVPTSSITEVKKSPMDVFAQAREAETGVYIFNREKIAGVMLTQEQYETLVQELEDLRKSKVKKTSRPAPAKTSQPKEQPAASEPKETAPEALSELAQALQHTLVTGATISAKILDERMVALGFITKKTGFGGVTDMLHELTETGKINYQLRKKQDQKTIFAEVIGEQASQSQLFDKMIVKKVYLHTR
jgi:restriction endonuclease Mrr